MKIHAIPASQLTSEQTSCWIDLLDNNGVLDNPFFRPEYVRFAADVLPGVEVGVLEDQGHPVGFFPFERHDKNVGLAVGGFLSDLHGVIARPDTAWNADELIRGCGLSAWQFDHLLASQQPFVPHHSFTDDSGYMDLSDGYDAYCQQRTSAKSSVIKNSARKFRKLEREIGPVRFTAHTSDSKAWDTLKNWKRDQLLRLGYADMFRIEWVNQLLDALRPVDTPGFAPLLSTLHAGDELLAVHLGVKSPTVVSSWIPTFAHEYAKYSPGLILHLELARWAADQGVTRVDLCRGENQMKTSLMSDAFPVAIGSVDHRVVHRTLTQAYYGIRNLVHASPLRDMSIVAVRRLRSWLA